MKLLTNNKYPSLIKAIIVTPISILLMLISAINCFTQNNNADCISGFERRNNKNTTVRIYTPNAFNCTGILINNSHSNGLPYVLTASHCLETANQIPPDEWIFEFNDEVNCNSGVNKSSNITTGAEVVTEVIHQTIIDESGNPDGIMLLRLNNLAPNDAYYSGYNANNFNEIQNAYAFHHPLGISKQFMSVSGNSPENTFQEFTESYQVEKWNVGFPQPGSSGCGLFNSNHLFVGTQHGASPNSCISQGCVCTQDTPSCNCFSGRCICTDSNCTSGFLKLSHAYNNGLSEYLLQPIQLGSYYNNSGNLTPNTIQNPIVIDNSTINSFYQTDEILSFAFYPRNQSNIIVELSNTNCGGNGNIYLDTFSNMIPNRLISYTLPGDFLSLCQSEGTYELKLYNPNNTSEVVYSKSFNVYFQNSSCNDSNLISDTSSKKSLSSQNDFTITQDCSTSSYELNFSSSYSGNFNLTAQIYDGSTLISTTTDLTQAANYPYTLINSATSDLHVVLSGNTDTYCYQSDFNFVLGDCPGNTTTCDIPTNLNTNISGNQSTMSWASSSSASSYDIQYSNDGVNPNNGGSNGYTSTSIAANFSSCNTHYFRVRANCSSGTSAYSPWQSFYISSGSNAGCTTPSLAINQNGSYVQTNWNNVNGETGYELQHRVDGGNWSGITLPINSNSNLYPAQDCKLYEARIRTICSCVTSGWSSIASVTSSGCSNTPTCSDGIQNGNETGVDCGGSCIACPSASCNTLQITWPDPNDCGQLIALETSQKNIIWAPYNCSSGLVDIEYSINGGSSWTVLANNTTDDGIHPFTVTTSHVSNQFRIRVSCTSGNICGETCNYKIIGDSVAGCTDQNSHNYNASATYDNGTCETCYDGVLNGDEQGIDCGGNNPLCTPCNAGNNIEIINPPCNGTIYPWAGSIEIEYNAGTNACTQLQLQYSWDGGVTWQNEGNAGPPTRPGDTVGDRSFQANNDEDTGDVLFRIICLDNPSNYDISECTYTFTSCGGSIKANSEPCNAMSLSVGSSCNPITLNNCDVDLSSVPTPLCEAEPLSDIWYKVVAPSSGAISLSLTSTPIRWPKFNLYAGSCSSLTEIGCNGNSMATITSFENSYTSLSPGSVYYLRVYNINKPSSTGDFDLCVWEEPTCSGTLVTYPSDITINCPTHATNLSITGDVLGEATLCPSCNESSYADTNNYSYCGGGTINRIWTYNDECGVTNTHNQVITIISDFTQIDFDTPDDVIIRCDQNHHDQTLTGAPSNVTGVCGPTTIFYDDNFDDVDYCSNTGRILRFWYAEDDQCGTRVTKTQNIYLTDNNCYSTRCQGETCATAEKISYNGTYFCDGASFGNSANANDATHADWYVFTAEEDGYVSINTCYNNVDTRLYFHEGSCYNVIANNDDDCPMSNGGLAYASSIEDIPVVCGQTYYLEWDSRWSQEEFLFDFQFEGCSTPVNGEDFYEDFEGSWIDNFEHVCTDDLNWIHSGSGTPSDNTGPTGAYNGSLYLYLEGSGSNHPDKVASITSTCFDLTTMVSPHIAFASHMWGNCMGELIIEARVVPGGNWTTIFYQSGDRGNQWIEEDIPLPGFAGEIVQFKITGVTGHCYETDIAIDGFGFFDHCISNYHVGGNLFLGAGTTNYTEVDQQITMDAKLNTGHMILDAGNNILFQAGAEVKLGATIHAYIDGCDSYHNSLRSSEAKK